MIDRPVLPACSRQAARGYPLLAAIVQLLTAAYRNLIATRCKSPATLSVDDQTNSSTCRQRFEFIGTGVDKLTNNNKYRALLNASRPSFRCTAPRLRLVLQMQQNRKPLPWCSF